MIDVRIEQSSWNPFLNYFEEEKTGNGEIFESLENIKFQKNRDRSDFHRYTSFFYRKIFKVFALTTLEVILLSVYVRSHLVRDLRIDDNILSRIPSQIPETE